MDKIEVSGRTLQEALQTAADKLGVSVEGIEHEVVHEGTKGFLGLGQAPTVIKAWVKEGWEPVERPVEEAAEEAVEPVEPASADTTSQAEPASVEAERAGETSEAAPEAGPVSAEDELSRFTDTLMSIMDEILGAMKLDVRAALKSAGGEEVEVELAGRDVALLIGRRGQTLDALQYLVSIAANKASDVKRRVIVDAENYRRRHRETLENKAREYARSVKEHGKEAVLEPQSARDRRIIHLCLADDPDVYTYSEGEGPNRHVVISPKK